MSHYSRGASFERAVAADLTKRGYVTTRAAGSHGIADVVALKDGQSPLLVQCKTNGKMSAAEIRALRQAAHKAGAIPIKASRPRRGVILYERHHSYANAGYVWGEVML